DRSPDSPCLHCGPNSAAPKIINPAHKPANQQRRSPASRGQRLRNVIDLADLTTRRSWAKQGDGRPTVQLGLSR
ncbi:hypothetical protein I551_5132, partial [Mycobacterium ulcerans str. Harvey]